MTTITIENVRMTKAAAENVEETRVSPSSDIARLRSGEVGPSELLAECLDGADADRVQGWREYVDAVVAAAEVASVTDDQIRDLSTEAGLADDQMQRLICSIALGEDVDSTTIFARSGLDEEQRQRLLSMSVDEARRECARVIADAQAQQ